MANPALRSPRPSPAARRAGRILLGAGLLACTLGLAGCGSRPAQTFDLSAPQDGLGHGRPVGTLVVTEPVALQIYDGDRIVVRDGGGALSILGGAQWSDRLPRLIQSRMIQTFENAQRFKQVGYPADRLDANYAVVSEIRSFEIDAPSRQAVVEIAVKLVRSNGGNIAAGKLFSARAPVASIDGPGATAALDAALSDVLRQIVAYGG